MTLRPLVCSGGNGSESDLHRNETEGEPARGQGRGVTRKDGGGSVDWKLIVEISLLPSFIFSFRQRLGGRGSESPRGLLLRPHKNKNGSVNENSRSVWARGRGRGRRGGGAGLSSVFCGAMCRAQKLPITKCSLLPLQIKAEWGVLGFSFGGAINRKA